jgi:hypothetical protein
VQPLIRHYQQALRELHAASLQARG